MKGDKTEKIIGALIAIFFIVMAGTVGFNAVSSVYRLVYNVESYESKELKSNQRSFEKTAERLLEFYEEEKETNETLEYMVVDVFPNEEWEITCVSDSVIDNEYVIHKEVTEEEKKAYSAASSSFNTNELGGELRFAVKVLGDRVVFSKGHPYAIVYMKNGLRPRYIFSSDEDYKSIFVDRLSFKLFQTVGKE